MYVRPKSAVFCFWLWLLALAPFQVAHAGFSTAQSSSGWRIDWDSGTMHPSAQFVPAPGAKAAGNTGYAIVNGSLQGSATGKLPLGSNVIDVTARVIPDKPSVGAAVGKFLFKVSFPLQVGIAAYDLIKELGFDAANDSDGALQLTKPDPSVCSVAPCYEYATRTNSTVDTTATGFFKTKEQACEVSRASYDAVAGPTNDPVVAFVEGNNCRVAYHYNGVQYTAWSSSFYIRSVAPSAGSPVPATQQELADKIASQSGWTSSSAFPEVVRQAVESGETITAPSPTVTGPSTVQGPKSTATEGGKTVEKQTVYNINYNSNQVSYTTTVTTVTTNSDGSKTTATETKEQDKEPDECAKNPDTLNCLDLGTPTSDVLKKSTHAVNVVATAFASGSGCPVPLSFSVRGLSYSISYQPVCDRLAILRVLFIAMAGVIAAFILADSFRVQ